MGKEKQKLSEKSRTDLMQCMICRIQVKISSKHNDKQREHQEARHPKKTVLECFPDMVEIACPPAASASASALKPSAAAAAAAVIPKKSKSKTKKEDFGALAAMAGLDITSDKKKKKKKRRRKRKRNQQTQQTQQIQQSQPSNECLRLLYIILAMSHIYIHCSEIS